VVEHRPRQQRRLYLISTNSVSKIKSEFAGMRLPMLREPYARSIIEPYASENESERQHRQHHGIVPDGIVSRRFSPTHMPKRPWSQPYTEPRAE